MLKYGGCKNYRKWNVRMIFLAPFEKKYNCHKICLKWKNMTFQKHNFDLI